MMEILKQIVAKGKAFVVIESCVNLTQCKAAEKYIDMYYNKFEDICGFEELRRHLLQQKGDLLVGKVN